MFLHALVAFFKCLDSLVFAGCGLHTRNPSALGAEAGGLHFEVRLDILVRSFLKKRRKAAELAKRKPDAVSPLSQASLTPSRGLSPAGVLLLFLGGPEVRKSRSGGAQPVAVGVGLGPQWWLTEHGAPFFFL